MPPRTIFLSRLIGLYAIIVALALLANKQSYVIKVTALFHDPPLLLLTAVFALSTGLAIILTHNVWSLRTVFLLVHRRHAAARRFADLRRIQASEWISQSAAMIVETPPSARPCSE
jgi:hypothetical protein